MHFVLFVFVVVYVLYFVCWGVLLSLRGDFTFGGVLCACVGYFCQRVSFPYLLLGGYPCSLYLLHIVVELM